MVSINKTHTYSNVFTQSALFRRSSVLAELWSSQVSGNFSNPSQPNSVKIESSIEKHDILQHLTHNVEPIMLLTLVRVYIGSTNMVGIAILEYKLQSLSTHISASDLVTCLAGCCGTCQTLHNVNILKVSPGLILITQLQPIYDRKYKYANTQVNKKISGIELVWLGASHWVCVLCTII